MSDTHLPSRPESRPKPAPGFCSRCRKSFPESFEKATCPACGDELIRQGYCPVCESYLALPVGVLCPKHDLPLDAMEPPRIQFGVPGEPVHWVTVCHFANSLAAQAPRIRLEAEGIPTFVDNERMGSPSMYHVATGGVRLKVPDTLASEARVILSQTWSALAAELDLDPEDEDDHEAKQPDPAAQIETLNEDTSLPQAVLFLLAVGLPALFLAYLLLSYWRDL